MRERIEQKLIERKIMQRRDEKNDKENEKMRLSENEMQEKCNKRICIFII